MKHSVRRSWSVIWRVRILSVTTQRKKEQEQDKVEDGALDEGALGKATRILESTTAPGAPGACPGDCNTVTSATSRRSGGCCTPAGQGAAVPDLRDAVPQSGRQEGGQGAS